VQVTTSRDDAGRLVVEVTSPDGADLGIAVTLVDRGFLARRGALGDYRRTGLNTAAAQTLMRFAGAAWRAFRQASAEPPPPAPRAVTIPDVAPTSGPSPFDPFPYEESP
jgi:hypothetical protein